LKRVKVKEPTLLERLPQARFWVEAGIRPCCAGRLVRAGYTGVKDLARSSRAELRAISGIGDETLAVLEGLLGHPLPHTVAQAAPPRVAGENRRQLAEKVGLSEEGGLMAGARRLLALARRRKSMAAGWRHGSSGRKT